METLPDDCLKRCTVHPCIARIMNVSVVADTEDATMDSADTAEQFGITPTKAENFIRCQVEHYKAALPAT